MRIAVTCVLALAMGACQSTASIERDKHTGRTLVSAPVVDAYSGLFDFLHAKAFYSTTAGYAVGVSYSNYGWIYIDSAYSNERKFEYLAAPSDVSMCGGGGGCITTEKGVIKIDKNTFDKAALEGFEFKLVGKSGNVTGKIPAENFKTVIDQMNSEKII